jgi:hypothetical protein
MTAAASEAQRHRGKEERARKQLLEHEEGAARGK